MLDYSAETKNPRLQCHLYLVETVAAAANVATATASLNAEQIALARYHSGRCGSRRIKPHRPKPIQSDMAQAGQWRELSSRSNPPATVLTK